MDGPWHITVEVSDQDWESDEGPKNLCGSPSQKNVRYEHFDVFLKAYTVKEVCEKCLELFKSKRG